MTREEMRAAVLRALATVAPELDPSSIAPDRRLRDQVDLDSVDFLNFLVALHDTLGIDVPDADYEQVQTLDRCVDYLLAHAGAPATRGEAAERGNT